MLSVDVHYKLFLILLLIIGIHCDDEDTRCKLPRTMENGVLMHRNTDQKANLGSYVNKSDQFILICNQYFAPYSRSHATCQQLQDEKAECLRTCSPIVQQISTNITCTKDNQPISCTHPYHGTSVIIECEKFYENTNQISNMFICIDGQWKPELNFDCQPICGRQLIRPNKLLINAESTKIGEFPWQIAVYRKKTTFKLICGGVLITPKLTLSAAHCFKNDKTPEVYYLGAGKYYSIYLDPRDENAQYTNVVEIIKHELYSTLPDTRHDNDIAIVVHEYAFEINEYTSPACLLKQKLVNDDALINRRGIVTGWGYTTEIGSPSEILKQLQVAYESRQTCKLKYDFKKFYFPFVQDKICAGLYNESKSTCRGDSGSGLMFLNQQNERFYVRGIVSIGPHKVNGCDSSQYTLYTSTSYHTDFIMDNVNKYKNVITKRLSNDIITYKNGCTVPFLENGNLEMHQSLNKEYILRPGYQLQPDVELLIRCNEGFRFQWNRYSDIAFIRCNNSKWEGGIDTVPDILECKRFCTTIDVININATCYLENEEIDCDKPTDGTVVRFDCDSQYWNSEFARNPFRYCEDGFWSDALPICVKTCGMYSINNGQVKITENVVKTAYSGEFPWSVGIYKRGNSEFLCSATLISHTTSITNPKCLENFYKIQIIVVTDRQDRFSYKWRTRSQILNVNEIFSYLEHNILIVKHDEIRLTELTQPICPFNNNQNLINKKAFLGGWQYMTTRRRVSDKLIKVRLIIRENEKCGVANEDSSKICAEITSGIVCMSETGNALVTENDNDGKYSLVGIANIQPKEDHDCNSTFVLFTSAQFINNLLVN